MKNGPGLNLEWEEMMEDYRYRNPCIHCGGSMVHKREDNALECNCGVVFRFDSGDVVEAWSRRPAEELMEESLDNFKTENTVLKMALIDIRDQYTRIFAPGMDAEVESFGQWLWDTVEEVIPGSTDTTKSDDEFPKG